MQDLISFVQDHDRKQREDLAGEVLALLLREEPGQNLIGRLTGISDPNESPVEVLTRKSFAGCVPDILLIQNGQPVAILELKFRALLTANQLSGRYSKVAPVVIFVVPEERKSSIDRQLSDQSNGRCHKVVSWIDILEELEKSVLRNASHNNRLFLGALEHLKEFCKVENDSFVPFTSVQLRNPVRDSFTQHLVWLTKAAISSATKAQVIQEAGRPGAGYDELFFYGQNVMLGGFKVWFGFWPLAWFKSPALGPLWVQFSGTGMTTLIQAGTFPDGVHIGGISFPLLQPSTESASTEDEVLRVTAALKSLGDRLLILTQGATIL